VEEPAETSDVVPQVDIAHNSTVRIPKLRRKTPDDNATIRIPKMARVNEFALDGKSVDNSQDDDIFEQYYNEADDLFVSGSFDASVLREPSAHESGKLTEEGENEN
jgi:hypothetical protein